MRTVSERRWVCTDTDSPHIPCTMAPSTSKRASVEQGGAFSFQDVDVQGHGGDLGSSVQWTVKYYQSGAKAGYLCQVYVYEA